MKVATIGLDIAKNVFQVHGVDGEGVPVLRRKVRRDKLLALFADLEPCLVGSHPPMAYDRSSKSQGRSCAKSGCCRGSVTEHHHCVWR